MIDAPPAAVFEAFTTHGGQVAFYGTASAAIALAAAIRYLLDGRALGRHDRLVG